MADTKKEPHSSIRSAGPLPATFLLHVLEEGKANQDAEILARLLRGEITRKQAFYLMHPLVSISVLPAVLMVVLAFIMTK